MEETAVSCAVEALVWVNVSDPIVHENGDQAQYLDHTFRCRYLSGDPYAADDESVEVGWFSLDDLPAMNPILLNRIATASQGVAPVRLI